MKIYLTELGGFGDAELSLLLPLLPPRRREAAERARNREARASRIVGYAMLSYGARQLLPDARLGELILDGRGKPHLPDHRISFSLSHTACGLALAIGEKALGVDLEIVRPLRPALVSSFASEAELALIQSSADQTEAAIALWTKKEAEAKRSGYGIAQDLRLLPIERAATRILSIGGVRHALSVSPAVSVPDPIPVSPSNLLDFLSETEKPSN